MGYNNNQGVLIHTKLSVPFKWEKQPGIAKDNSITYDEDRDDHHEVYGHDHWRQPANEDKQLVLRLPLGEEMKPRHASNCFESGVESCKLEDGSLLPLPPAAGRVIQQQGNHSSTTTSTLIRSYSIRKNNHQSVLDPFRAAYEECTKKLSKTKMLADGFGRDNNHRDADNLWKNEKKKKMNKKKKGSWKNAFTRVEFSCKNFTPIVQSHVRINGYGK